MNFNKMLFVTYGDKNFYNSKNLLAKEAYSFGFQNIVVESPETLPSDFLLKHSNFFESSKRGGGYWLWKSLIIKNNLEKIKEGEIIVYADAGCVINARGKKRFNEWIEMCLQYDSLSFQMEHPEKFWTKMNVALFLGCEDSRFINSGQLHATIFLLKKTKKVNQLINDWFDTCSLEWTIDDSESNVVNDPGFKDHRHDQSVFSLLRKKQNHFFINDETYPAKNHDWGDASVNDIPILAKRRKF